MKKLTVKDFIAYNNPCFSCGSKIAFQLGIIDNAPGDNQLYFRSPNVTAVNTEIDLHVTYSSILQVNVNHKTNQFEASNQTNLEIYLRQHSLFLRSRCDKCGTIIQSQFLDFNFEKNFICPVGISAELLNVRDNENMYEINSSFLEEKSTLYARTNNHLAFTQLDLPLLPKYKFKNKDHFINKMKTYLLFS